MLYSEGAGEPIVFVHGNGSTHATWGRTIAPMTPYFRCIAYDLAGHGDAGPLPETPSIARFVDDLARLKAELGLQRVRLVGHSLGAFIAAAYAVQHPAEVEALALLAAPAFRTDADRRAGAELIARLRREGVAAVMSSLVASWYRPEFLAAAPEALQERLAQIASIATWTKLALRFLTFSNPSGQPLKSTEISQWQTQIARVDSFLIRT